MQLVYVFLLLVLRHSTIVLRPKRRRIIVCLTVLTVLFTNIKHEVINQRRQGTRKNKTEKQTRHKKKLEEIITRTRNKHTHTRSKHTHPHTYINPHTRTRPKSKTKEERIAGTMAWLEKGQNRDRKWRREIFMAPIFCSFIGLLSLPRRLRGES